MGPFGWLLYVFFCFSGCCFFLLCLAHKIIEYTNEKIDVVVEKTWKTNQEWECCASVIDSAPKSCVEWDDNELEERIGTAAASGQSIPKFFDINSQFHFFWQQKLLGAHPAFPLMNLCQHLLRWHSRPLGIADGCSSFRMAGLSFHSQHKIPDHILKHTINLPPKNKDYTNHFGWTHCALNVAITVCAGMASTSMSSSRLKRFSNSPSAVGISAAWKMDLI